MTTETHEHALTQKALDTLTAWGRNPGSDGGETIAFSVSRQGAPSDSFRVLGDCTPFTPAGKRGTLNGQAPGRTGEPTAYFFDFSQPQVGAFSIPCTFSFDLNAGKVTLSGAFPNLPATLDFRVEYFKEFDAEAGDNLLFYSDKSSDDSGYVIVLEHVAAA